MVRFSISFTFAKSNLFYDLCRVLNTVSPAHSKKLTNLDLDRIILSFHSKRFDKFDLFKISIYQIKMQVFFLIKHILTMFTGTLTTMTVQMFRRTSRLFILTINIITVH